MDRGDQETGRETVVERSPEERKGATPRRDGAPGPGEGAGSAAGLARIRSAAEEGDPEAMYLLGVAYAQGRFVPQDDAEAAVWFKRAAVRDHRRAKVSLGYCCATGRGVRRDLEKAYVLLREAADEGDPQGFKLAEKVARRLHGEVLRRCEREIKRRRILRAARKPPPATPRAAASGTRPSPAPPPEEGQVIEIDVPKM